MPIVFAGAAAHAPGITGWPGAAPAPQALRLHGAYRRFGEVLRESKPEVLVMFTAEHWANFFLNNYPAFCVGRAQSYEGPLENSLNISRRCVPGDAELSADILAACFASGIEPSFSDELSLDHGVMIPLHFIAAPEIPLVPIVINALTPPLPSVARCFSLGRVVGDVVARSKKRVALVASGGLSHNPGTPTSGDVDQEFDTQFLGAFMDNDQQRLLAYSTESIAPSGFGTQEIRNWIALAGAAPGWRGRLLSYEAIPGWATGCAVALLEP
jgi:2,3-dihydroxyphenylpropionate 1,2-dioxygenase